MKFLDILALRPAGDDTVSIRAAIERAEIVRNDTITRAGELERAMTRSLLTATDAEMEVAEREAAEAKRAADRLEALLAEMRAALVLAEQRELQADEAARRRAALAADADFVAAWRKGYPKICELCATILVAQRVADEALAEAGLRNDLPRHEVTDFRRGYDPYHPDPLSAVLKLAALAPSEIRRRDAEVARIDAIEQERKAAEDAERRRRAAAYIEEQRVAATEDERRRAAQTLPPRERAQVLITGEPGFARHAPQW